MIWIAAGACCCCCCCYLLLLPAAALAAALWLNLREYAQKLRHYLPQIDDAGVEVVGVSLGTVDAARDFCGETGFPLDNMFMVSIDAISTSILGLQMLLLMIGDRGLTLSLTATRTLKQYYKVLIPLADLLA